MAKKDVYFDEAEELYVIQALTLESISKRIPVSTRTLQEWSKQGNWERKRADRLRNRRVSRQETEDLYLMLVRNVKRQFEAAGEGEDAEPVVIDPVQGRLILGIQRALLDAKKYEELAEKVATDSADESDEPTGQLSDEEIAHRVSELIKSLS